jgi:hypothetical protein
MPAPNICFIQKSVGLIHIPEKIVILALQCCKKATAIFITSYDEMRGPATDLVPLSRPRLKTNAFD